MISLKRIPTNCFVREANAEAQAHLNHPVPGERFIEISKAWLELDDTHATSIFSSPDDMKLKYSMKLFSVLPHADPVFGLVLTKYFNRIKNWVTLN